MKLSQAHVWLIVIAIQTMPAFGFAQHSQQPGQHNSGVSYNFASPPAEYQMPAPAIQAPSPILYDTEAAEQLPEIACSCGSSECSKCLPLLGSRRDGSTKELWVREQPSGTQGLNFPYHTRQLYYYKRPYNTVHVRTAHEVDAQNSQFGMVRSQPAHPYSTEVFDVIHEQLSSEHRRSTELGYLEYSDWRRYEAARQEWALHRPSLSNQRRPDQLRANLTTLEPRDRNTPGRSNDR